MKKILSLFLIICILLCCFLTACGGKTKVDFTNAKDFETALNAGDNLTGKTVTFTVDKLVPNSALGYNLQTGEHLNFCSSKNPGIKEGDSITVKVTEVSSMLGSYIITYEKVK
jgi:predicted small lipoprotein YifL